MGEKLRIGRDGSLLDGRLSSDHLVPNQEAILHESTVIHGTEAMSFGPKMIQNRPKRGEKPLGLARGFEPPHGSLSLSGRLVRAFRSVV